MCTLQHTKRLSEQEWFQMFPRLSIRQEIGTPSPLSIPLMPLMPLVSHSGHLTFQPLHWSVPIVHILRNDQSITPVIYTRNNVQQEAQLTLTNLGDAFIGQSRSPNIVPFHVLDIVSYCASSLRRAVFLTIFDLKKCRDIEIGVS